jgi:ADP-ribose pyrophosphatase
MDLKERYLRRKKDVKGRAVGFRIDEVRLPDGKTATREYLFHPGAVAVVALLGDRVLMVRQYRYPVGELTWEIPAGKLDPGENPRACIKRELEEETGYRAGRVWKLLSYWPTAAFANEVIHIYVADRLTKGTARPDEDEFLTCRAWRMTDLMSWIRKGRIRDSKTLIALMAYRDFGRRS